MFLYIGNIYENSTIIYSLKTLSNHNIKNLLAIFQHVLSEYIVVLAQLDNVFLFLFISQNAFIKHYPLKETHKNHSTGSSCIYMVSCFIRFIEYAILSNLDQKAVQLFIWKGMVKYYSLFASIFKRRIVDSNPESGICLGFGSWKLPFFKTGSWKFASH